MTRERRKAKDVSKMREQRKMVSNKEKKDSKRVRKQ